MKLSNRFYNEEKCRLDAENLLDMMTKEEAKAWHQHPCTQSLLSSIQGDMCGILNMWLEGGYSNEESVDVTAQRQAKARGMSQALDDLLETIYDIGHLKINNGETYDYAGGTQSPD